MNSISVIGTGDFTHPKWLKELDDKLEYYASDRYVAETLETQTGCRMSS